MSFFGGFPRFGNQAWIQNPYGQDAINSAQSELQSSAFANLSQSSFQNLKQSTTTIQQADMQDNGLIDGSVLQGQFASDAIKSYIGLSVMDAQDDGILNNSQYDQAYLGQKVADASFLAQGKDFYDNVVNFNSPINPLARQQETLLAGYQSIQKLADNDTTNQGLPLGPQEISRDNILRGQQQAQDQISAIQRLGGLIPDSVRTKALQMLNTLRQGGNQLLRNFNSIAGRDGDSRTISAADMATLVGPRAFERGL